MSDETGDVSGFGLCLRERKIYNFQCVGRGACESLSAVKKTFGVADEA